MTSPGRGEPAAAATEPLLALEGLSTEFSTEHGQVRAVDGVSFEIFRGEVVGVVGESGCGKSATAMSILGLLPKPHGQVVAGSIRFRGRELAHLPEREMRKLRGRDISMIFQDPMTSLNPYLTVGEQLAEVLVLHLEMRKAEAWQRAVDLLRQVSVPAPEQRAKQFPHELSGGMRQRVMIAMALLCEPSLLVADEPTTALDVTIQAQILDLLASLQKQRELSILLITHDLGVVASTCDRVVVMYAGRVVESAPSAQLFREPAHPYTRALLESLPGGEAKQRSALRALGGLPPRLDRGPFSACTFAPRCRYRQAPCEASEPALRQLSRARASRCHFSAAELAAASERTLRVEGVE